ncbi:progestin and adipoQ receptor family member 3-like [Apostichopus japonicus]|uniref:progestin and adipoQ receptor family member 3-like n=1 Tax=Stichopus japonicus TaxID=307972 RepID=UPI003AB8B04A
MDSYDNENNAVKHKGIDLFSYAEVPHFLQGNQFIQSGYRVSLSSGQCIQSLFYWSNESVNIWTHLIGFLIFLLLGVYDNLILLPSYDATFWDYIVYTLCLTCFQFCMMCSAGYHLFCAQNEEVCKSWLALDLAGICIGLLGCYFPGIYYAYFCFDHWRRIYLTIACILILITFVIQTHQRFLSARWAMRRLLLFCTLVAYGVFPVLHWVYLNGGMQTQIVQTFLPKVVVVYFLGVLALAFYATKCPERCFPGRVDFLGSSHQWWHILVVLAFIWWHSCGVTMMKYRQENECTNVERMSDLLPSR